MMNKSFLELCILNTKRERKSIRSFEEWNEIVRQEVRRELVVKQELRRANSFFKLPTVAVAREPLANRFLQKNEEDKLLKGLRELEHVKKFYTTQRWGNSYVVGKG